MRISIEVRNGEARKDSPRPRFSEHAIVKRRVGGPKSSRSKHISQVSIHNASSLLLTAESGQDVEPLTNEEVREQASIRDGLHYDLAVEQWTHDRWEGDDSAWVDDDDATLIGADVENQHELVHNPFNPDLRRERQAAARRRANGFRIAIGGLHYQTTAEELKVEFKDTSGLLDLGIHWERDRSSGHGWAIYDSFGHADAAVECCNGKDNKGQPMTVKHEQEPDISRVKFNLFPMPPGYLGRAFEARITGRSRHGSRRRRSASPLRRSSASTPAYSRAPPAHSRADRADRHVPEDRGGGGGYGRDGGHGEHEPGRGSGHGGARHGRGRGRARARSGWSYNPPQTTAQDLDRDLDDYFASHRKNASDRDHVAVR